MGLTGAGSAAFAQEAEFTEGNGGVIPASAPAFVTFALTGNSSFQTSITANAPASIVSGNLLVAVWYTDGTTTFNSGGLPSGWALDGSQTGQGGALCMAVAHKTATGSEPGTYTFTTASGSAFHEMWIGQYSNATMDGSPAFGGNFTSGTAASAPSVTPSKSNDYWIVGFGINSGTITASTPSGMTARGNDGAHNANLNVFDKALTSNAATGAANSTLSGSINYGSVSLLLHS